MSFFPMAGTAIKNLFSKPATRLYPFVKREPFAGTRGDISIDYPQCIHCGMCMRRCPAQAITVSREKKEWKIDHLSCVICGNCVLVCPKKCLKLEPHATAAVPSAKKADRFEVHVTEAAPAAPAAAPADAPKADA
jgi:formate hydrogenlyase subunit 6/NADH:ubiquinone oxidoreductase subunit I